MKPDQRDILICTVQHTGTWTLAHNLSKHPEVGGVKQPPINLTQDKFKIHNLGSGITIQERLAESKRQVFLYHVKHAKNDASLVRACHVVGGLRDPILTLLTARRREIRSGNSHSIDETLTSISDQWLTLLDWIKLGVEVNLVPVDQPQIRDHFWKEFLLRASLSIQKADWAVTNTSMTNFDDPLLQLYQQAKMKGLLDSGETLISTEIEKLLTREDEFCTLFEKHGYDWYEDHQR